MKVRMKDNYLVIQRSENEPCLCIDSRIAGLLLYEIFASEAEDIEEWGNNIIELLKELHEDD